MLEKFEHYKKELTELEQKLTDPAVIGNQSELASVSRKHRETIEIIKEFELLSNIQKQIEEAQEIIRTDEAMAPMAEEELKKLKDLKETQESRIEVLLLPKDPNDEKNVILEIRAGAGGEEAALFGAELFRMYQRYAERNNWKIEVMDISQSDNGGIKEVIAEIKGERA